MDTWGLLGPSPGGGIDRDIYLQHKAAIAPRQDGTMLDDIGTDDIKSWRSIITLIIFVLTNIIVLCPFYIPIYIPRQLSNVVLDALSAARVISKQDHSKPNEKPWVRLNFPVNFVTAPIVADLFLLAILAIGRQEVHDGTLGADGISPIDIMAFFITLAYIAISIDASGLIRFLAFKVLQKGGKVGHRLFFYLYIFFFGLGSFIGNDPIILSGTAFLAYMTRVSSNIVHPRAWIHSQFAIANIASAILVSSNPTNLVLAGAFQIKFIDYTANMIVPVVVTAIVLFPFLLYIVFADESLIPISIKMHELSDEAKAKKPVNPNIPNARGTAEEEELVANDEQGQLLSLEEIMNPFLDKGGAAFGAVVMAATLVTVLALNAASQSGHERPVYWVTVPAAFVMFCWDVGFGWHNRHETREIARRGREEIERARAERDAEEESIPPQEEGKTAMDDEKSPLPKMYSSESNLDTTNGTNSTYSPQDAQGQNNPATDNIEKLPFKASSSPLTPVLLVSENSAGSTPGASPQLESSVAMLVPVSETTRSTTKDKEVLSDPDYLLPGVLDASSGEIDEKKLGMSERTANEVSSQHQHGPMTLTLLIANAYRWLQETFPTVMAVLMHLPFALVPFAFAMFVLVQALVTKGWVQVFAHGWDHWVQRTGTVGSIGGMGFISVILCNFAGTNIGTTILLSRVIQHWAEIHKVSGTAISNRTFWGTVYGMAVGVNYGAFSTAFSASLAGLLWRDILARKHIRIRSLDFARVNLPIIAISMAVGLTVLVGEVYIMRDNEPYKL